jgi:hypothetical protein
MSEKRLKPIPHCHLCGGKNRWEGDLVTTSTKGIYCAACLVKIKSSSTREESLIEEEILQGALKDFNNKFPSWSTIGSLLSIIWKQKEDLIQLQRRNMKMPEFNLVVGVLAKMGLHITLNETNLNFSKVLTDEYKTPAEVKAKISSMLYERFSEILKPVINPVSD